MRKIAILRSVALLIACSFRQILYFDKALYFKYFLLKTMNQLIIFLLDCLENRLNRTSIADQM